MAPAAPSHSGVERMTRASVSVVGVALLGVGLAVATGVADSGQTPVPAAPRQAPAAARPAPRPAAPTPAPSHVLSPALSARQQSELVATYCATCHSERAKAGGLSLAGFDAMRASENPEVVEKMIRKLSAGLMPPPGAKKPELVQLAALTSALESRMDEHAAANPNPGRRTFQRLNRPEYERAIADLLGLDVDAANWLPLDQKSANFDNIADEQALSPTLLEAYLNAAGDISRMAVGDRRAARVDQVYTNPSYVSQHPWDHVEGAPFGTRGGMVVDHVFPADAEYEFELLVISGDNARGEDLDVSIDGQRVALIKTESAPAAAADGRGGFPFRTEPILVRAGSHRVAAAFVRRSDGPYEDLIKPHEWSYAGGGSGGAGITTLPHLRDLVVAGPYNATGVSETPTRQRIFTCRPTSPADERPCARSILTRLAGDAYRRPLTVAEVDSLMPFYESGAKDGGFEAGVRGALEAVLASPHFVFRMERERPAPGTQNAVRVADVDLASRLSFFLWGAPPDDELLDVAASGKLTAPGMLEKQARRLLADPRAEALGTRFAAQWLRLQDLDKVHPDPNFFPNFDENIAAAMKEETQTFFNDLVRRDASLLDLYTADYTFVNERLARHYGFQGVVGPQFRKVAYPDRTRRGLIGQGSVLVQTSLANRTSPVLRGKWVMEVLLGTPPPPPPPNIPALEETGEAKDGKLLTTRERMELHRANPTCNACHRFMDPIGLSLDSFDVTGRWRVRENGMPLDTRGDYYDGSPINDLGQLADALMKRPEPLVRTFTENLMAYALGRRVETFDQPTVRAIARQGAADGYRMSSFILGVVKSDAFQRKRADAPVSTDAAPDADKR
jgi:mono/diheme cytochrome c family protein